MASLVGMTSLGVVTRERVNKSANLFFMPIPGSDSSGAIVLDLFGVTGDLNIEGTFVNLTASKTIAQFIVELENLVNGNQSINTYTSDKAGKTYSVYVDSIDWDGVEGNANAITYSIAMKVGGL
jgi:hypothetical protein